MAVQPGTHLGPYEILAAIGAGGMGEVYRARDSRLGREVAIKVLPEVFARDAELLARFQREAKFLASLNHPNIASIYGLEDSDSTRALVMELVEGPTLADRIKQGPIPVDEALPIAKQICDALEYAHEHGIIHRDLKPANVKVTADDTVKILDFGLAKALGAGATPTESVYVDGLLRRMENLLEGETASADVANSPTLSQMATQAGVLLGTAAYMSPEQAKGKVVDRRTDIWAFGCVLYEMLTGRMAFRGEAVTDTLAAVIMKDPDWSQLPAATPMRVRVLLQRCLQKDPKQRLRDIGDARISLDEVLSGGPETAPGLAAPMAAWRRTLPWAGMVIFGLVAILLAFGRLRTAPAPLTSPDTVRFEIRMPQGVSSQVGGHFAVSPDGRQLAFFGIVDGVTRLWVRPLNSLQARPLPGSEVAADLPIFWSPDSRYVAFDAGGKLKRIAIAGGPPETICDVSGLVVGGSWNGDGVIIFGYSAGPLLRVSSAGGTPTPLTALDLSRKEVRHTRPVFLPDGRHFVYTRFGSPEYAGAYIGSLDVKAEAQSLKPLVLTLTGIEYVPSLEKGSGYMLFMRDRALLAQAFDADRMELAGEPVEIADEVGSYIGRGYFSASGNGVLVYRIGSSSSVSSELTWLDGQGKVQGARIPESGGAFDIALSPDAQRVALTLLAPSTAVWLHDFLRGTTTRFTFGAALASRAVWSPDGSMILFSSTRLGGQSLYRKPADGSRDEELVLKGPRADATSWSRDARFVLYSTHDPKNGDDVWVLPLKDGGKPFPLLQSESNERDADFSPDVHWVAYTSDESGRAEIYVRPFSPDVVGGAAIAGAKWLISTDGGVQPHWRGDGKELYYMTADNKIMAVDIATAPSFHAGIPKLLFQAPPATLAGAPLRRWDVTRDGKRFLFITNAAASEQAPFTVALNWQAALKK